MVKKERGMTLLEMVLVLVVVLAVLFVSTRYYIMGRTNARVAQAMSQIDSLINASNTWVAGQTGGYCATTTGTAVAGTGCQTYAGCTNPICTQKLIDAGLISKDQAINPFSNQAGDNGKYAIVMPRKENSAQLMISYYLPKQACNALLQKLKSKVNTDSSCKPASQGDYQLILYFE